MYTVRVECVCVCVLVWEREMERDRVCVHVRVEAERDCQHRVELMCQMSEESVRVVAPSGGAGCRDAHHALFRCLSPASHSRCVSGVIWLRDDDVRRILQHSPSSSEEFSRLVYYRTECNSMVMFV